MDRYLTRIAGFLKHNNAVPIVLMFIFLGGNAALAASPEVREQIYKSEDVAQSVDNSFIVAVNLETFDFNLVIGQILEDDEQYYVTYSYQTIAIDDYAWKIVQKIDTLNVSKVALEESYIRDLGTYVAKTLGDNLEAELVYLKRVQDIQRKQGLSQKVLATEYSGLIGSFLDTDEKVFPNYDPMYQERSPEEVDEKMSPNMIAALTQEAWEERLKIEKEEKERLLAEAQAALANASTTDDGTDVEENTDEEEDSSEEGDSDTGGNTDGGSTEEPPVEEPPAEQPPAEEPPVEQPPAEEPPAEEPPAEQPPVEEPEPEPTPEPEPEPTPEPAPEAPAE